jgi:uncharacterized protein (TIGR02453 family)
VSTGFAGFGEYAVEFYDGLEADNSKVYWTEHRETYDRDVKAPMLALLAAVEKEFGAGKVFRPFRDVRFSADKTPYKTHCGAIAGPFYVEVGPGGLMAAGGYYGMAPDQLARFRTSAAEDRRGDELAQCVAKLREAGLTVGGEQLKTRPRGVEPDHPRLDLLRHKGLYAWRRWEPDDILHEPAALKRVTSTWRAVRPLTEWLAEHVGRSELPRR